MQRHKRCGFNSWVRNILWRRKWQHTPVFLPGESHGQRSLMGYSPWGHKGSEMTEWLSTAQNRSRKVNPKLTSEGIEPEKEVGTRTGAYYIHKLTWEIERDHFNCPWGRKARWIMGDALGRKRGKTWLGGVSSSFLFKHREKAWAPGLTSDCPMTGQLGNHLCAPMQVSGSWCRCWSPAWTAFGWSPVSFSVPLALLAGVASGWDSWLLGRGVVVVAFSSWQTAQYCQLDLLLLLLPVVSKVGDVTSSTSFWFLLKDRPLFKGLLSIRKIISPPFPSLPPFHLSFFLLAPFLSSSESLGGTLLDLRLGGTNSLALWWPGLQPLFYSEWGDSPLPIDVNLYLFSGGLSPLVVGWGWSKCSHYSRAPKSSGCSYWGELEDTQIFPRPRPWREFIVSGVVSLHYWGSRCQWRRSSIILQQL